MKWNFGTKLQLPPEPLTRGLSPPDPRSVCPLSSTEFVEPPRTKFLGMPLLDRYYNVANVKFLTLLAKYVAAMLT